MIKSILLTLSGLLYLSIAASDPVVTFISASETQLSNPHDIKLSPDENHLFVSDVNNSQIVILDAQTLEFIGAFGADHQKGTHDVDIDQLGQVYVADTHNHRIAIYALEGLEAMLVDELNDNIRAPEGVLVHKNGRVYVAGAGSDNVVAFAQGNIVAQLSGLSSPHDLEVNPDGNIWLADSGNNRMLLLSQDLEILKELSGEPYNFNGVRYQDVLSDGTLIVADKNSHSVKFINPDGHLIYVIGDNKPSKGPYQFTTPEGVEVKDDILWIADSGNDRIVKYKFNLD